MMAKDWSMKSLAFASACFVEVEKDLSLKRQYLDIVILEQEDETPDLSGICDGFDNLSRYNLLSYKSKRQSLNAFAME